MISPDEVPGDIQIILDLEVTVGSFVAVLDSSGDHVAQVIDITDTSVLVHCYGTKISRLSGEPSVYQCIINLTPT